MLLPFRGRPRSALFAAFCLTLGQGLSARAQPVPVIDSFTTSLPILRVETGGQEIVDEVKVDAELLVFDDASGINGSEAGTPTQVSTIAIEIRGRSSQGFDKKSFGFETRDPDGDDVDVALLGLPEESDWVLHGPYSDKTLVRNAFAYTTARTLGRYAPRSRLCELIVDDDYRGVYLLVEKVKRGEARVDIAKLKDTDLTGSDVTGGYIFETTLDFPPADGGWTGIPSGQIGEYWPGHFNYVYPKARDIAPEQAEYLRSWVTDFERALVAPTFADLQEGYPKYLDVDSWVDYVVFQELTRDVDAYLGSTFLVKEKDADGGRLRAGPVWDHNLSFGNADYCGGQEVDGFVIEQRRLCYQHLNPLHFTRVWEDPAFRDRAARRWRELREGPLSEEVMIARYDSLVAEVETSGARERNYERWLFTEGVYRWPNAYVGPTYTDDVAYVRSWLRRRAEWLDGAFAEQILTTGTRETLAEAIEVYPNPTRAGSAFSLALKPAGRYDLTATVTAADGRVVWRSERFADDAPLSLALPTAGVYTVDVRAADGSAVALRRVVVY